MNPDKNYERRRVLTELLKKTPFQFQFMSINDDIELTPDAIAKNHDSKKTINSLGRDLTRGELASTLNHLLCYKKFLDSENDIAIILEDDADFIVDKFNYVISLLKNIINENKPQVYLLTPAISYLNNNSQKLSADYKVVEVVQSLDSSGYILTRKAAEKMISANSKAWFIADEWVKYKRHANVNVFSLIPPIVIQNTGVFGSNLANSRGKLAKSRTLKYVLSRVGYKVIADLKKYLWLMPFKGYIRNKGV
jgi:glycosyl transferase, family 25